MLADNKVTDKCKLRIDWTHAAHIMIADRQIWIYSQTCVIWGMFMALL